MQLAICRQAAEGQQIVVAPHQVVGDRHQLAEHVGRGVGDADVVAQRFGHLVDAVQAFQQRHGEYALRRLPVVPLQFAPHQQVEFLVGAAQLEVGLERDGIVALHQRVDEFMDGDGLAGLVALAEIVALQHLRHGVGGRQLDQVDRAEFVHPGGVEHDFGLGRVEHFEHLVAITLRIGKHLLTRQRRAGGVLAGGVADHAGEVADQEQGVVPQVLQLAHLVEQHGVAEVQVGRGRVETGLDAQRTPLFELLDQFGFEQQFVAATLDLIEDFLLTHVERPLVRYSPDA